MSGRKTVCGFSIILIFKEIMTFESQRGQAFCRTKYKLLKKKKRNRKQKIPHTVSERRTLRFTSHKNSKLKVEV